MRAYSKNLRQNIIDAYNNKEGSYRQLAKRFCVSLSFIQTLIGRYQHTGRVEPLPHAGGNQPKLKSEHLEVLKQLVQENNDATLDKLCELLKAKTQIKVSRATMGRVLNQLQITRKRKNPKINKVLQN
ncbi:MAG: transposase [Cyanobacteria bacterium J06639_18]